MIRSEFYLLGLILPFYYFLTSRQKTPLENLLSKKLIKFRSMLNIWEIRLLSTEYRIIKKNLRMWRVISIDSKYLTYFRFIKFYEFVIKKIAVTINSINTIDQIDLFQAIDIINLKLVLEKHYTTLLHQHRKFRNQFIHDLGLNLNVTVIKPNIIQSFQILNIILTQ